MAEDFSYPADQYVLLGKITKVHGLRGEVKIVSYSGQPENFQGYKELVLVAGSGNLSPGFTVERVRVQGKTALVQLGSITSREQAERIVGQGVLLAREFLPDIAEDEYYWYQYQGKLVVDQNGRTIGRVESLFSNGAQDILVVRSGAEEVLIPVTKSIVVGETAEALIVNPPPGLLDLERGADD